MSILLMEIIRKHFGMVVTRKLKLERFGQPIGEYFIDYTKGMSQVKIKELVVAKAEEFSN